MAQPAKLLGGSYGSPGARRAPLWQRPPCSRTHSLGVSSRAAFSRRQLVFQRPRVPYYHLGHRYQRLVIGEKTLWCRLLSPAVNRYGICALRLARAAVFCKLLWVIRISLLRWRNKR